MKKTLCKRIAAVFLSMALAMGSAMAAQAANTRFTDVSSNAWYQSAVEYATENNLFSGNGDGTFDPDGSMTRAMFVTVLAKVARADVSSAPNAGFQDVPQTWYTPFVNWAYDKGYVAGTSATTFQPETPITRQQIAVILRNYIQEEKITLSPVENPIAFFRDVAKIESWARTAVDLMRSLGLMSGDENGNFNPSQMLTRAEAASVFMKFDLKLREEVFGDLPEEEPATKLKETLTSHVWNASIQTLDMYQFFDDGTGVNLYSVSIPTVIPFTYTINESNSTVTITFPQGKSHGTRQWTYSEATDSFFFQYTEFPSDKLETYTIPTGSIREQFQSAADYCETMWNLTAGSTAQPEAFGNDLDNMKSLLESIRQYLGYVMSPAEFAALNSQLETWEQELEAAMDDIGWTGAISSLERLTLNKEWTMEKIGELIDQIP